MTRLIFVGLLVAAWLMRAALAQQQPVDPRIATPLVNTLHAEVELRDAMIKILQEDAAKREKDWAAYSAPLWQAPEK